MCNYTFNDEQNLKRHPSLKTEVLCNAFRNSLEQNLSSQISNNCSVYFTTECTVHKTSYYIFYAWKMSCPWHSFSFINKAPYNAWPSLPLKFTLHYILQQSYTITYISLGILESNNMSHCNNRIRSIHYLWSTVRTACPLKMKPTSRPETSVANYQSALHNVPEE
jgi:hypothetical protein